MNYLSYIDSYRGIAPGMFIARELGKRSIQQKSLAVMVGEHPQTINAVIAGRRGLTVRLALEIEKQLQLPEGFLLILQAFHDIDKEKRKAEKAIGGGAPAIRRALFWDTDFDAIDWPRYKKMVISRVMERGNEDEKKEILRFYGESGE